MAARFFKKYALYLAGVAGCFGYAGLVTSQGRPGESLFLLWVAAAVAGLALIVGRDIRDHVAPRRALADAAYVLLAPALLLLPLPLGLAYVPYVIVGCTAGFVLSQSPKA